MKYKLYKTCRSHPFIEEETKDFLPDSQIGRILSQYGFSRSSPTEDYDLLIFRPVVSDFFKIEYLHSLLSHCRETSVMLLTENTTKPSKAYKPVLTLYPGDFSKQEDRRTRYGIQYWDTCIWQRWADFNSSDFPQQLEKVLYELKIFYQHKLYEREASMEYCDFITRMYRNSYLIDLDTVSSHANFITPFPFFSEGSFDRTPQITQPINGLVWRVLLVDDDEDYKYKFLKSLLGEYNHKTGSGLYYVIDLNRQTEPLDRDILADKPTLLLKQVFNLEKAKEELKDTSIRYDIICLDYLLGKTEKKSQKKRTRAGDDQERQTGKQLLDELKKDTSFRRSISNKFWIFLTTSYPTAFLDDLQHDLTALISDHWNIERGASFIQSPNYFLSCFTGFLFSQLKETRIRNLKETWKTCLEALGNGNTPFSRGWANDTLTKVLNGWAEMKTLKNLRTADNPENIIRCFADRYFRSQHCLTIEEDYKNGLYDYLSYLLFMLSFGDGYAWEQMKTNMEEVRRLTGEGSKELGAGFQKINEHITKLKTYYDP